MTGYVYQIPLHKQPRIIESEYFIKRSLPQTDKFCNSHFTPPNYPELKISQIEYIIESLNNFK